MDTTFYHTPGDAWQVMYQDCQAAKNSIQFEQYILRDDVTGQKFLKLFIEKLGQGVSVALILDAVGSRGLATLPLIQDFIIAGGIVHFYNPMAWYDLFRPWKWLPRNHNKLMLIDGEIGHIGSVCIAKPMRNWRDIHLRFTGDLVKTIQQDFVRLLYRLQHHKKGQHLPQSKNTVKNAPFYYSTSRPHLGTNPIYKELLKRIREAKKEIYLVTPYFLPTKRLLRALRKAAKRKVAITVMVGEKTDVSIADRVSRSYLPTLLRNKINILLYEPPILHAKYSVIDGQWAMLGSTNLDYLSLIYNREANMLIQDKEAVDYLRAEFIFDAASCKVADWNYWHKLPLTYKLTGYLGRFMKRML